jgi:hypothetical protein
MILRSTQWRNFEFNIDARCCVGRWMGEQCFAAEDSEHEHYGKRLIG